MRIFNTIILSLLVSVTANAQIQTKFWGLEIGKEYPSLEYVENIIKDKCKETLIYEGYVGAFNGSFAGYTWDAILLEFSKGETKTFQSIKYAFQSSDRDKARKRLIELEEKLTLKYGQPISVSQHEPNKMKYFLVWGEEDHQNVCVLQSKKTEDTFISEWLVVLQYFDKYKFVNELLQSLNQKQQEFNEL